MHNQKGKVAEDIVVDKMRDRGYFAFKCANPGSHPFDFLFVQMQGYKLFIGECKAHEERVLYEDTGINSDEYEKYLELRNNLEIDFIIFFVDYKKESIYGGEIGYISKNMEVKGKVYPAKEGNGITYFPTSLMQKYFPLSQEEVYKLKSLTRSQFDRATNR